jgi:hypothetical protein
MQDHRTCAILLLGLFLGMDYEALKGQYHEMGVEMRPWNARIGLDYLS